MQSTADHDHDHAYMVPDMVPAPFSYDAFPYPSRAFPATLPSHLGMVATLFGMSPPPVERCRVLELGCSSGGNLIPMAAAYPQATYAGVDLSERQIREGLESVQALGLQNISLRHLSILDVGGDFGQFDYIICHGVFSWVPAEVRDKILAICRDHLSPHGVAYVSYNAYPGWRMRGIIRDALRYHVKPSSDPAAQIRQARAMLDFLAESARTEERAYRMILNSETELLRACDDSYVLHEHLEEVNEPMYFQQFVGQAEAKGLQYLSDARMSTTTFGSGMSAPIRSTLNLITADRIAREQYLDFLCNRTFRSTLLCRREIALNPSLSWGALGGLDVAANFQPKSAAPQIAENTPETFTFDAHDALTTSHPLIKAALWILGRIWPRSMRFEALLQAASEGPGTRHWEQLGIPPGAGSAAVPSALRDPREVGETLLQTFLSGLVQLSLCPPAFVTTLSERPQASPLSRFQAGRAMPVTNRKHVALDCLDGVDRHVLQHLDGTRDRSALLAALWDACQHGLIVRNADGEAVSDPTRLESLLDQALDDSLRRLASNALLIA